MSYVELGTDQIDAKEAKLLKELSSNLSQGIEKSHLIAKDSIDLFSVLKSLHTRGKSPTGGS